VFIIQFRWGMLGAAIATNVAYIGNMLIQDLWVSLHSEGKFQHMWLSWGRSSTDGIGTFLEYSIPTAMIEAFYVCSLELFVLIAGYGIMHSKMEKTAEKTDFSA